MALQANQELIESAEHAEVEAWVDMYEAAPADFRSRHQLRAVRWDRAVALHSKGLPLAHFNSVIGLGAGSPIGEADLDLLIASCREAGAGRFMIHLVPGVQPEALEDWLLYRGMKQAGAWERAVRSAEPMCALDRSGVEQVTGESAVGWARFLDRMYCLPTEPWLLALSTRRGWHHYLLREQGEIVAVRSMFVDGRRAWFGIDAPVPGLMTSRFDRDARLCAAMTADALDLGVTLIATDIEAPQASHDGPAYAEWARLGFAPLYLRRHFVPA